MPGGLKAKPIRGAKLWLEVEYKARFPGPVNNSPPHVKLAGGTWEIGLFAYAAMAAALIGLAQSCRIPWWSGHTHPSSAFLFVSQSELRVRLESHGSRPG